jgi:hypothetical protein
MTREELIQSAAGLKQPSPEATAEYSSKADAMATMLNERFGRRTDIVHLIGEGNLEMMQGNHRNHYRFMISLFGHYSPEVFTETVLWVFRAYHNHGFQLTYWPAQLDAWLEIFKAELSPECFDQIYPFYHWMIVNNPIFAGLSKRETSHIPEHNFENH